MAWDKDILILEKTDTHNMLMLEKEPDEKKLDEQILRKAIEKAIEEEFYFKVEGYEDFEVRGNGIEIWGKTKSGIMGMKRERLWGFCFMNYREVIFSHNFAKAFWNSNKICRDTKCEEEWDADKTSYVHEYKHSGGLPVLKTWQYHLQQMVLEEEPIKYLGKFLNKELNKN